MRRFLAELQRRNVFRAGAACILGSWVVIQVVNNVSEQLATLVPIE